MTDRLQVSISIASVEGGSEACELEYERGEQAVVELKTRRFGTIVARNGDAFEALCKIRLELEKVGFLLLCNGARRDAYPSRLSRQMSGGRKVYLHRPSVQGRRDDLVDIFDPASLDQVASVAEQRATFEAWLGSLT